MSTTCSGVSRARDEPLAGTAPRVVRWLLVEVRGRWEREPLATDAIPEPVRQELRVRLEALELAKLFLIRRPERRAGDGIRVYLARGTERTGGLAELDLGAYEELLDLDLPRAFAAAPAAAAPLVLVCGHGRRDACCARLGGPVYDTLRGGRHGGAVWQSSHLGGHRFAANVAVLPDGIGYGRVEAGEAEALIDRHLGGELTLERLRGRSAHAPPVQAAEHAVRLRLGLPGATDLELVRAEGADGRWRVRFRLATGGVEEVDVAEEANGAAPLSCGADPEPTVRFRVL